MARSPEEVQIRGSGSPEKPCVSLVYSHHYDLSIFQTGTVWPSERAFKKLAFQNARSEWILFPRVQSSCISLAWTLNPFFPETKKDFESSYGLKMADEVTRS